MTNVVVPFRAGGKSRLPPEFRDELARAMLADVLAAAVAFAPTRLVTDDRDAASLATGLGATVVHDPGDGQGAAVWAGLEGCDGVCAVVNADCPRVRPADLAVLADVARRGHLALVEARDGTTNALGLPVSVVFAPLYGRDSARRFRAHATSLGIGFEQLDLPRLVDDVDTVADLTRVASKVSGPTNALAQALLERTE